MIDDALEEEMRRIHGFDPQAAGEEEYDEMLSVAEARHADCLRFPEIFRYYWEEDSVVDDDEWDVDNFPEAGE